MDNCGSGNQACTCAFSSMVDVYKTESGVHAALEIWWLHISVSFSCVKSNLRTRSDLIWVSANSFPIIIRLHKSVSPYKINIFLRSLCFFNVRCYKNNLLSSSYTCSLVQDVIYMFYTLNIEYRVNIHFWFARFKLCNGHVPWLNHIRYKVS